jgi:hypothetical protein
MREEFEKTYSQCQKFILKRFYSFGTSTRNKIYTSKTQPETEPVGYILRDSL